MANENVCVVVPAFNESSVIASTITTLREAFSRVVVVDDGSRDSTADLAVAAGAVVVRHPVNRGQGAALQTGFDYFLKETPADFCLTFDGDGQHRVEDALSMVERATADNLDVVLASRFLGRTEKMPASRRLLLRAAIQFSRVATGLPLTDTHNGLRVLSRNALRSFRLTQDRMAYATELEAAISRNGLTWAEVPTTVLYTEYSIGKGQANSNAINILFDLATDRIRQTR